MALNPSTLAGRFLRFESGAVDPGTLGLVGFAGREAMSRLYRFEIDLVSDKPDIDLIAILKQPAYIGMKQGVPMGGGSGRGVRNLRIHGTLESFEEGGKVQEWVAYRAVLVPRLWRLTLNTRSRIFMEKKVPEIVEQVLKDNGFTSQDYEFKTTAGNYPQHEYVVQYQETDFNFICRLLEHAGAFFYFSQGEECEKVVFGDSTSGYEAMATPTSLPYRPAGLTGAEPLQWFDPEAIRTIHARSRMITAEVALRDYNWRTPSTELMVSEPVVPDGYGRAYEYGDHYKNVDEGKALAKVRAEEWKCRQVLYPGTGDCRGFRAGMTFQLEEHFRSDFNQSFLLTEVRHTATQSIALGAGSGGPTATYTNEFVAIPASQTYRPERITPRPRVVGTLNAKIDAGGGGEYAEIDDEGRYKVLIPFDLEGKTGGQASRYIRMAQPYAGGGMGMHFPLHKGTEVLLTHIGGDPDRPVIAAAVPNTETTAMVKGGNQTQCMIHTGGGNNITIEDQAGGQRIYMVSPTSGTFMSMGAPLP